MISIFTYIIYFLGTLVTSFFIFKSIYKFITIFKLYPKQKGRDLYKKPIPSFLGIGYLFVFFIGTFFYANLFDRFIDYPSLLLSLTIIGFIGVRDDLLEKGSYEKLFYQLVAINILLFQNSELVIVNLNGFLGIDNIPYIVGLLFTNFIGISVINSFNLIDGIDGNAGFNAIVSFSLFLILFWNSENYPLVITCTIFIATTISYLKFNFSKKTKAFMGDTGAMIIGFSIFLMTLVFLNKPSIFIENIIPSKSILPLAPLSIFIIPIIDTVSIYYFRIKNGKSPFKADNLHMHHLFLRYFSRSHLSVSILINFIGICFNFIMSLLVLKIKPSISILTYFLLVFILVQLLNRIRFLYTKSLGAKNPEIIYID